MLRIDSSQNAEKGTKKKFRKTPIPFMLGSILRLGISILLLSFIIEICPASAEAKISNAIAQQAVVAHDPFYNGLKKVGLFLAIPAYYQTALKCKGKEQECADQNGATIGKPELQKEYIQELETIYQKFPATFYPENLIPLLQARISEQLLPLLPGFDPRKHETAIVLNEDTYEAFAKEEDALTVIVKLELIESGQLPLILISTHFHRSRPHSMDVRSQVFMSKATAMSLNSPKEDLDAALRRFVRNSILVLTRSQIE